MGMARREFNSTQTGNVQGHHRGSEPAGNEAGVGRAEREEGMRSLRPPTEGPLHRASTPLPGGLVAAKTA